MSNKPFTALKMQTEMLSVVKHTQSHTTICIYFSFLPHTLKAHPALTKWICIMQHPHVYMDKLTYSSSSGAIAVHFNTQTHTQLLSLLHSLCHKAVFHPLPVRFTIVCLSLMSAGTQELHCLSSSAKMLSTLGSKHQNMLLK